MVPIPESSFLDEQEYLGFRHGAKRWRRPDGERLYTWDYTHGHIEVFNMRGDHLGVLDALSGAEIGEAARGRKIDV